MHCFKVKKLRVKIRQNCYNAEKVLSFVAPSGEQELTKIIKLTPSHLLVFVVYIRHIFRNLKLGGVRNYWGPSLSLPSPSLPFPVPSLPLPSSPSLPFPSCPPPLPFPLP